MKRFLFTSPKPLVLLWLVFSFAACDSGNNPQKQADINKPFPHMYVDDSTSFADEHNFLPYAQELTRMIHKEETDSIYYPWPGFKAMIEAFGRTPNIEYLDIYNVVDTSGKLTLLFSPGDSDCNTLGFYRLPEGATTFPQVGDTVPGPIALNWQNNYIRTVVDILNPHLDSSDAANYIDGNRKTPIFNTLHLSHNYNDFVELDTEVTYQTRVLGNPITGIKAFFSARGQRSKGTQLVYSNRLYILLEFTTGRDNHIFYLPKNGRSVVGPDMPTLDECEVPYDTVNIKKLLFGGNNGQMCPPTCNP
jgi:hypothetical protein